MKRSEFLRKLILPGLATLGAVATSGVALAQSVVTGNGLIYATQSIVSSGGALTVPGTPGPLSYTTAAATAATATGGSFTLVFTIPTGVTPTTSPVTATVTNTVGVTCVPQSALPGVVASSAITFSVPTAAGGAIGDKCKVALNGFSVSGATALEAVLAPPATTVINYKAVLTSETNVSFPVDPTPAPAANTQAFATSESGLVFASLPPATPNFATLAIDVATAGLGKKFKQGGTDALVGDIGGFLVAGTGGLVESDGATPFAIGVGAITITITGNFNNIATSGGAVITPASFTTPQSTSAPCGTGPALPAGTPGVITPTSITFSGVSLGTGANVFAEVCVLANGTGIIGNNPKINQETATATVATTTQKDATPVGAGLVPYDYNGAVQQILYSGNFAAYPAFVRLTNNSGAAANVIVAVQPDTGTAGTYTGFTGAGAIPGNTNLLVPASTIISGSGVVLDSTNRASLLFLTPGAACVNNANGQSCPVSVSEFIVNPNGTLTFEGSGTSP